MVVIGSHVDVVKSLGQNPRDKMHHLEMIANKFCKQTCYMKLNLGLSLDCCRPSTTSMSNLRDLLKKTYTTNPKYVLFLGATILLGLLERDFSNVTACQTSTILEHVQQVGMHHLTSIAAVPCTEGAALLWAADCCGKYSRPQGPLASLQTAHVPLLASFLCLSSPGSFQSTSPKSA